MLKVLSLATFGAVIAVDLIITSGSLDEMAQFPLFDYLWFVS